jgi:hypothetical protein
MIGCYYWTFYRDLIMDSKLMLIKSFEILFYYFSFNLLNFINV